VARRRQTKVRIGLGVDYTRPHRAQKYDLAVTEPPGQGISNRFHVKKGRERWMTLFVRAHSAGTGFTK
jgi:hypothetical protein